MESGDHTFAAIRRWLVAVQKELSEPDKGLLAAQKRKRYVLLSGYIRLSDGKRFAVDDARSNYTVTRLVSPGEYIDLPKPAPVGWLKIDINAPRIEDFDEAWMYVGLSSDTFEDLSRRKKALTERVRLAQSLLDKETEVRAQIRDWPSKRLGCSTFWASLKKLGFGSWEDRRALPTFVLDAWCDDRIEVQLKKPSIL